MNKSIYIVDDEVGILEALSDCLSLNDDFHITTYSSVDAAIRDLKNVSNGVLITDMKMPGKDGLHLLKWIQDHDINLEAKICITGYTEYEDSYLRSFGMTKMFQKPLCFDDLLDYIESLH